MAHDLQHTIAILGRTPPTLDALLRGLPEALVLRNEGGNTWSALEVLGHLIDGERVDWIPRARMILQFGESEAFSPFDRLKGVRECQGKPLDRLLDEFSGLRTQSLHDLRSLNLRDEDLEKRGRHPSLGPVSLSELLAAWAAHDLSHLHQISRVLAYSYRLSAGPFREYLGVFHRAGHGSS